MRIEDANAQIDEWRKQNLFILIEPGYYDQILADLGSLPVSEGEVRNDHITRARELRISRPQPEELAAIAVFLAARKAIASLNHINRVYLADPATKAGQAFLERHKADLGAVIKGQRRLAS